MVIKKSNLGFAVLFFIVFTRQVFAGVALKSFVFEKGEVVNLCFMNSKQNLVTQKLVKDVATIWLQYANIKFNFIRTPCRQLSWWKSWWDGSRHNLVRIYIGKNLPNQSFIGKQVNDIPFREATMLLKISETSVKLTNQERSSMLHEFGHVLGLAHEHFHPDIQSQMNESVLRECEEIAVDLRDCRINLKSYTDPNDYYLAPFDKDSIMMYNLKNYNPSFEKYTRKKELSPADIRFIQKLYPR